jgi:hypothetical protein
MNRGSDNTGSVMLSASEQWNLLSYYLLHEVRSVADLLAHRREISKLDPSLPHRAEDMALPLLRDITPPDLPPATKPPSNDPPEPPDPVGAPGN